MTEIDTIGTARNQLRTAIVDFQPTLRAALRWWFICPIKKIRVAKLCLPPDATQQAHRLTYRSRQSSLARLARGPDFSLGRD